MLQFSISLINFKNLDINRDFNLIRCNGDVHAYQKTPDLIISNLKIVEKYRNFQKLLEFSSAYFHVLPTRLFFTHGEMIRKYQKNDNQKWRFLR